VAPEPLEYRPAPHAWQVTLDTAADTPEYEPETHSRQAAEVLAPGEGWNEPG